MTEFFLSHFAPIPSHFVNRKMELHAIWDSWNSKGTEIIYLQGVGGIGKTSIVSAWLSDYESSECQEADFVFTWSFHDSNRYEVFLQEFANFVLGGLEVAPSTEEVLLQRIAKKLKSLKYILVLDGVEKLGPDSNTSHHARVVANLLNLLVSNDGGLILITCRAAPPYDMWNKTQRHLKVIVVPALTVADASSFLKATLPNISNTDAIQGVQALGGHPLAITVLARYIETTRGKDIQSITDIIANIGKETSADSNRSLNVVVEPGRANEGDINSLKSALKNLSEDLKLTVLSSK